MTAALPKHRLQAHVFRDDPETALMLRVRRNEPDAFTDLVSLVGPRIYARMVRTFRDRHQAEDLTQEVLLRVYRARLRYLPRARFTTWLFHITQNVARNALRRRRKHACLGLGQLEAVEALAYEKQGWPLNRDGPVPPLERREAISAVRAAIHALAGRQRQAMEMQQFQNRSYADIAAALELTTKATKSLLYRARLTLKGRLHRFADM